MEARGRSREKKKRGNSAVKALEKVEKELGGKNPRKAKSAPPRNGKGKGKPKPQFVRQKGERSFFHKDVNPAMESRVRNSITSYAQGGGSQLGYAISTAEKIYRTITMPASNPPARYGDVDSAAPTATAKTKVNQTAVWQGTPQTNNDIAATDGCCFGFRHALRQFILYNGNNSQLGYNYQAWFSDSQSGNPDPNSPPLTQTPTYPCAVGDIQTPKIPYYSWSTGVIAHGLKLYGGVGDASEIMRFFWVDSQSILKLTYTTTATTVQPAFQTYRWTPGGVEGAGVFQGTGSVTAVSTIIVAIDQPAGYYAFTLTNAGLASFTDGSITITNANIIMTAGSTSGTIWSHLPAPGLSANDFKMGAVRILGTAITYTNSAAFVSKEGNVYAGQLNGQTNWISLIDPKATAVSASVQINLQKDICDEGALNGHYIFLKPTGRESFKWQRVLKQNNTPAVIDSCYPLQDWDDYIFIYPVLSATLNGAQDGKWHMHTSYEYQTNDLITEVEEPPMSAMIWDRVIMSIRKMPQNYENPTHMANIMNWFKSNVPKVIGAVETALPYVMKGMSAASGIASLI
jgi:hypothetical protein